MKTEMLTEIVETVIAEQSLLTVYKAYHDAIGSYSISKDEVIRLFCELSCHRHDEEIGQIVDDVSHEREEEEEEEDGDVEDGGVFSFDQFLAVFEDYMTLDRDTSEAFARLLLNEMLPTMETEFPEISEDSRLIMQGHLCALIGLCISRIVLVDTPLHQRIMKVVQSILSSDEIDLKEEAIYILNYLSSNMGELFIPYLPQIVMRILDFIQNWDDSGLKISALSLIGDFCRATGNDGIFPYCDLIMNSIVELLTDPDLDRSVKPSIILAVADIGLAIEGNFEKYFLIIMPLLLSSDVEITNQDETEIEFRNSLQEAILIASSGLIQVTHNFFCHSRFNHFCSLLFRP
jgi:hypothetical protein